MQNVVHNDAERLSRREFMKNAGTVIGGVLLASPTLSTACNKKNTSSTTVATEVISTQSSTSEPFYVVNNPGGSSKVALDRLYSIEHIWIKKLGSDVVQIGVTDKFQKLLGYSSIGNASKTGITKCLLPSAGTIISVRDSFGSIESNKANATLISPVSGEVIEINQDLLSYPAVLRISFDPYNNGWMLKIQLSKPEELNDLVSSMYYAYLQTQDWTGPVPEVH
jgi:glycine cleavage system H protein